MTAISNAVQVKWTSVEMLHLRIFKEIIVSYGMHLPFVKQMLNMWSAWNRIISKDRETWSNLSWSLLLNYSVRPGRKMRIKPLKNKIGLEVRKSPWIWALNLFTVRMRRRHHSEKLRIEPQVKVNNKENHHHHSKQIL